MINAIKYKDLPEDLRVNIAAEKFLSAYSSLDSKNVVVWVANDDTGMQQELEYDFIKGRFLTRQERSMLLSSGKNVFLPKQGVNVLIEPMLEKDTNVLYEVYKVFFSDSDELLGDVYQRYYSLYGKTIDEIVNSLLSERGFPSLYDKWDEKKKVEYWVSILYRIRRQAGESGVCEDEAFEPSLIEKMREIDEGIDKILPICLKRLASIEQVDEMRLINSFENKTGCKLILC